MMFTRDQLQALSEEDCWRLLRAHEMGIGRLAFVEVPSEDSGDEGAADEGLPVILPVNYLIDAGRVVLRSDDGAKLRAAREGKHMAFEIDNAQASQTARKPESSPLPLVGGWWSVLVRGRASVISDGDQMAFLTLARLQPEAGGMRPTFIAIDVQLVTGRHIPA